MSASPGRSPSPPSGDEFEAKDCRRFLEDLNEDGTWGYMVYRTYTQLPSSSSPSTEQQPAAAPPPEPSSSAEKRKRSTSPPPASTDEESNQRAGATQPEGATTAAETADSPAPEEEQDPEADPQWRQIVDEIKGSIEDYLDTHPPPYNNEMKSRLRLPSKHLPGASMAAVRESLRNHFAAQEISVIEQHMLGIMVDEEVAASVLAGREPGAPKMRGINFGFDSDEEAGVVLKVVDGAFEEDEPGKRRNVVAVAGRRGRGALVYHGWMKATPRGLWQLWTDVVAEGMRDVYKGPNFVYDG